MFFSQRSFAQGIFALVVVSVAFALMGCQMGNDTSVSLNGTWQTEYDGYIVNLSGNTLEYDDGGYGFGFKGTILEITKFKNNGTAGIIFIKYTKKPTDFGQTEPVAGDFIGVYFRNLTNTTGEFANPVNLSDFTTPAKNSLAEAKTTFTADTTGDFVSVWSPCVKQ